MLRAAGQEGAAETMARQERTLGSMADAAAAARSEHARRLDQQRRRDAAPLLITPHRCRHRVFASNSSLPSSCGRSSTMKSSLHACAADCTDTRHRHSSAQANGGAPAAGWHPLRTYLSRTDATGQVVAKNHDDVGSPARSPAGATAPPCPCLCKGETPMKTRTSTLNLRKYRYAGGQLKPTEVAAPPEPYLPPVAQTGSIRAVEF